jgi:hypothetical protein
MDDTQEFLELEGGEWIEVEKGEQRYLIEHKDISSAGNRRRDLRVRECQTVDIKSRILNL